MAVWADHVQQCFSHILGHPPSRDVVSGHGGDSWMAGFDDLRGFPQTLMGWWCWLARAGSASAQSMLISFNLQQAQLLKPLFFFITFCLLEQTTNWKWLLFITLTRCKKASMLFNVCNNTPQWYTKATVRSDTTTVQMHRKQHFHPQSLTFPLLHNLLCELKISLLIRRKSSTQKHRPPLLPNKAAYTDTPQAISRLSAFLGSSFSFTPSAYPT